MISTSNRPAQLPLGFQTPSRASFAGFIPAQNYLALRAVQQLTQAQQVQERQGAVMLSGTAGTGKTHLLQAGCRALRERGLRAAYLPLAELVGQSPELLEGLGAVDGLALDELDAVAQDRAWQMALVALLDAVRQHGGVILLAARANRDALGLSLRDLHTRLGLAVAYGLVPLDDESLNHLIRNRAAERGLMLAPEVANYILQRLPRNATLLIAALDQLDKASLAEKRRLTVPLVREVLGLG